MRKNPISSYLGAKFLCKGSGICQIQPLLLTIVLTIMLCGNIHIYAVEPQILFEATHLQGYNNQYSTTGHINPEEGTIEVWCTIKFDPENAGGNKDLVRFNFNSSNNGDVYFNHAEKDFVFYMVDTDDNNNYYQQVNYPFIMGATPFIDTRALRQNDQVHIAVTWSKSNRTQRFYMNGILLAQRFFTGGLTLPMPVPSGIIYINADNGFTVDGIRIWNKPRAPRKISQLPSGTPPPPVYSNLIWGDPADVLPYINFELSNGASINQSWSVSSQAGKSIGTLTLHNNSLNTIVTDVTAILPIIKASMKVFMAADASPFDVSEGRIYYDRTLCATYGKDASLPLVTLYQESGGNNFTWAISPNSNEFIKMDAGMEGNASELRVTHMSVSIPGGGQKIFTYHFLINESGWRSGLDIYRKEFPAAFYPSQTSVGLGRQAMVIGIPLSVVPGNNVGWSEASHELGAGTGFGLWIPDNLGGYEDKIAAVQGTINHLHSLGLEAMLYIEARELFDENWALQTFNDSVLRGERGDPVTDSFGMVMTCRPGTSWFAHIQTQAERILNTWPQADGLFFDNSWNPEYAEIIQAVAEIANARGKSLVTNGGNAFSSEKADSILAEGHWTALGYLQYLGLYKSVPYVPIYLHGILDGQYERCQTAPGVIENFSEDIRRCHQYGGAYAFNNKGTTDWPDASSVNLLAKYGDLQKELNGRRWVLSPYDALVLPANLKGNIFENSKGDWLVTMVAPDADLVNVQTTAINTPGIAVNVPSSFKYVLSRAMLQDIVYTTPKPVTYVSQNGTAVSIPVTQLRAMGTLHLIWKSPGYDVTSDNGFGTTWNYSYPLAALAPAVTSAWGFEESSGISITDTIGSNNGTISGAARVASGLHAGPYDNVLFFNGSSSASIPDNATLDSNGSFTVQAWINPSLSGGTIASKHSASDRGWQLNYLNMLGDNRVKFMVYSGNNVTDRIEATSFGIATGTWTHIAAVYDKTADAIRIYRNGSLANNSVFKDSTWSGTPHVNSQPLIIGNAYSGSIDEVAVSNYAVATGSTFSGYATSLVPGPDSWKDDGNDLATRCHDNNSAVRDSIDTNSVIWSEGKMAGGPRILVDMGQKMIITDLTFGGFIHTSSYGIPSTTWEIRDSASGNFNLLASSPCSVPALGYYDEYPVFQPARLGKFDRTNVGRWVRITLHGQGLKASLGNVDIRGRSVTLDSAGSGYVGYDYEVLPGLTPGDEWEDDGNDLTNDGNAGTGAGSVIWPECVMADKGASIVFNLGGNKKVSSVFLKSYIHTTSYAIPNLIFEIARRNDLEHPNWKVIGTYAGWDSGTLGEKNITVSNLDASVEGYYLRIRSGLMNGNKRFALAEVAITSI